MATLLKNPACQLTAEIFQPFNRHLHPGIETRKQDGNVVSKSGEQIDVRNSQILQLNLLPGIKRNRNEKAGWQRR